MNKLIKILTCLLTAVALFSCADDDPIPMTWEFSNYDSEAVSAEYRPGFLYQVRVDAKANYAGEITLKCTNYPLITLPEGEVNIESCGFKTTKTDETTLKITFIPVEVSDNENIFEVIHAEGHSGKDTYWEGIYISRSK